MQTKWYFRLEYILLFLTAFELFYKHHIVIFVLFMILFIKNRIIQRAFNRDFFWVIIWGVAYMVFGVPVYSVLHIPALFCSFIIGYCMMRGKEDVFQMLLVIGVGYGLEGLLTVFFSGGYVGFAEDESSRFLLSIWGYGIGLTAQNAILYIFSGIIVYIFNRKDINWIWKVLAVFFELGFVYDSLRIASRSPIFYCPIIIMVSIIAYNGRNIRFKSIMTLLMIVLVLFTLYEVNAFGIKSTIENSYLFTRIVDQADGGVSNNGRFRLQSRFADVWSLDLMGGLHDKLGYYFHNTWLDMYAFSGIFGFFTFIILTIRVVADFIFIYRRTEQIERSIWAGVFTAFMLPMFFEPHYWGAPAYFAFFFIFFGMLSRRCSMLKQEGTATQALS